MIEPTDPKINLDTKEHVSTSVYIMPEEAIALRKELYDHWRAEPASFAGENGHALWYYSGLMVTEPAAFVEIMALETGLPLVFDSFNEAGICLQILNALRKRRGVSAL
jgi:hypothetical protein